MCRPAILCLAVFLCGCSLNKRAETPAGSRFQQELVERQILASIEKSDQKRRPAPVQPSGKSKKHTLSGTWVGDVSANKVTYRFSPDGKFSMTSEASSTNSRPTPPIEGQWRSVSEDEIEHTWRPASGWQRCRLDYSDDGKTLGVWYKESDGYPAVGHVFERQP